MAGDSSGGSFVAAVAAMAHDDGFDGITHQVLFYPVARPGLRRRPLSLPARERRGLRPRDGGLKPFNAFYLEQRRRPGRPAASRRSSARISPGCRRPSSSPPSTTRCATRASSTAGDCEEAGVDATREPLRGRRARIRPALLLDPGVPPGFRGRRRRLPERRAGLTAVPIHPLVFAMGPVRALQLLHRRPRAGHRRHRDRLVARRRHGPGARGDRPPDRGRPLDPADPRAHRPRRRRARPVGAHRPARAGRHPRGRRATAALPPRPRAASTWTGGRSICATPTARRSRSAATEAAISGEMEPTMLVRGGETISLGGDVTVSVHAIPGHTAGVGRVRRRRPERRVRRRRRPGARCRQRLPRLRGPGRLPREPAATCATRSVRSTCTSGTPTAARTASTVRRRARPRAGAGGAPGEPRTSRPASAARRSGCLADGLAETESPYSPFARVAEELGYTGDPTLEPSPFFTTMHGYRNAVRRRLMAERSGRLSWTPAARRSPSARTCGSRCATASSLAADAYSGTEDKPRPALVALSPYGKELQALALTMPPQRRPSPMWDGCIEAGDIARVVARGLRPRHRRPARLGRAPRASTSATTTPAACRSARTPTTSSNGSPRSRGATATSA